MEPERAPAHEAVILTTLPNEAVEVGLQPMACQKCGQRYVLPLYEMPDGPIVSVARCPACHDLSQQAPEGVAI